MSSASDTTRIKIGIFFNARREQGGLYQYAATLVDCLARFGGRHDYVLFQASLDALPVLPQAANWQVVELPRRAIQWRMGLEFAWLSAARLLGARWRGWLPVFPQIKRQGLDVMLYVKPGIHPFLWPYPAVFPIHDLQHRLQPEFREVSAGGEYNRREYFYRRSIPQARAILTDSEVGREDVIQLYQAQAERVFALPYLAPTYVEQKASQTDVARVRGRYALPENYYFYPAAFWPHKNHARILQALKLLKDEGLPVPLVLAGGKRHEYERLAAVVGELQIADQVYFLGYVPDEDLPVLYAGARALLMPTFFGPTNIPVLEAWRLGCPVVSSDIRGIREQVGDAGLLVDPRSPKAIAAAVRQLEEHPALRAELAQRGRQRLQSWGPREFAARLEDILSQAALGREAG